MRIKINCVILGLLFCLCPLSHALSAVNGSYAIKNATIITVTGRRIEKGIIVIQGDIITSLGNNVTIPENAEVIDASGLYVYPGMIDAATSLGLYEVGAVAATVDGYEIGTYNPHIQAHVAMNPHSVHIPISRVNGITSALVVPGGGVISGQSAMINLNGWTPKEMVIKTPVAIHVNFPRLPREGDRRRQQPTPQQAGSGADRTEKQINELRELFNKAKRYAEKWDAYMESSRPPAPDKNLMLEALVPVVKKELPVVISVGAEKDIENAVAFIDSMDIDAILQGVTDGWKVAKLLKKHNIPVIVGPVLSTPGSKDPYDSRYANAGILHKSGVKIAFMTGSAPDVRSLPYHAGTASAYGLPKEEALKAVTIYPAEIFGVAHKIGSLEEGKLANLMVTDGDPLEMKTQIKHLFIAGEKIELKSKHTEAYEKFRKRPKMKE